jgi:hypothetical protein
MIVMTKSDEKLEFGSSFVVISLVFVCFCCNINGFFFFFSFNLWGWVSRVKFCILNMRNEALRETAAKNFILQFIFRCDITLLWLYLQCL